MNKTMIDEMNLHLQSGGTCKSILMPEQMQKLIEKVCEKKKIKFSGYVKFAVNNQLKTDLEEINNQE